MSTQRKIISRNLLTSKTAENGVKVLFYFPNKNSSPYVSNPFFVDPSFLSVETGEQEKIIDIQSDEAAKICTNQQPPQRGGAVPHPFGLGRNGCWPSRGPQLPRVLSSIFSLCCPLNDHRRAAHSFFKIGCLFSLFLFSCPSLALLRLLILLLLLMSGNVHPNPGPIFPCSVCAGNVTWQGKSVQCCACSKWVHLRCSQLSLSRFRALGSSHSWSCPPCRITVIPSSDSSDMYTSTVQSSPASANAALSPHPRLQTSYPPSAHLISSPSAPPPPSLAPGFPSAPPASTPPLTLSGFLNGMLEVFKPEALNYSTFFRPILSTLSAFRNPILTLFLLSGFPASLLCTLIVPTPGLAFSLLIPRTLAAALSFSSGRAYLFLNFLPPLFLRLIPTLIT